MALLQNKALAKLVDPNVGLDFNELIYSFGSLSRDQQTKLYSKILMKGSVSDLKEVINRYPYLLGVLIELPFDSPLYSLSFLTRAGSTKSSVDKEAKTFYLLPLVSDADLMQSLSNTLVFKSNQYLDQAIIAEVRHRKIRILPQNISEYLRYPDMTFQGLFSDTLMNYIYSGDDYTIFLFDLLRNNFSQFMAQNRENLFNIINVIRDNNINFDPITTTRYLDTIINDILYNFTQVVNNMDYNLQDKIYSTIDNYLSMVMVIGDLLSIKNTEEFRRLFDRLSHAIQISDIVSDQIVRKLQAKYFTNVRSV